MSRRCSCSRFCCSSTCSRPARSSRSWSPPSSRPSFSAACCLRTGTSAVLRCRSAPIWRTRPRPVRRRRWRACAAAPLAQPHLTIKTKVFLIGALVPLLIDTMLVQYYWARTGYFTAETFAVWLLLELLAIGGSLIFVRSFGQSLQPLQNFIQKDAQGDDAEIGDIKPQTPR